MSVNFCQSCGAAVNSGTAFCGSCGAKIGDGSSVGAAAHEMSVPAPIPISSAMDPGFPVGDAPEVYMIGAGSATSAAVATEVETVSNGSATTADQAGDANVGYAYASVGSRFGALILDAIPVILIEFLIIYFLGSGDLFASGSYRYDYSYGYVSEDSLTVLLVGLGALVLYFLLMWVLMATRGSSPGKAVLGIRVIREDSGGTPGFGLALGRYLLRGLLLSFTLWIASLSPFWDSTHRNRSWWDRAVGTLVIRSRATAAGTRASSAVQAAPTPDRQLNSDQEVSLPDPESTGSAKVISAVPAWNAKPVKASPSKAPDTAAREGSWDDRPAGDRAVTPLRATAEVEPVSDQQVPWAAPIVAGAGVVNEVPGVLRAQPPHSPAPNSPTPHGPLIGSSQTSPPSSGSISTDIQRWESIPADAAIEHTRMAPLKGSASSGWWLILDDGRRIDVQGVALIGRDPAISDDDRPDADLVTVPDDTRTVSKTHLKAEIVDRELLVSDRFSTNGVAVITAGVPVKCIPGVAHLVPDGATVRYGDREFRVQAQ